MRKLLIAGNWKMNGGAEFTSDLLSAIKNQNQLFLKKWMYWFVRLCIFING